MTHIIRFLTDHLLLSSSWREYRGGINHTFKLHNIQTQIVLERACDDSFTAFYHC